MTLTLRLMKKGYQYMAVSDSQRIMLLHMLFTDEHRKEVPAREDVYILVKEEERSVWRQEVSR